MLYNSRQFNAARINNVANQYVPDDQDDVTEIESEVYLGDSDDESIVSTIPGGDVVVDQQSTASLPVALGSLELAAAVENQLSVCTDLPLSGAATMAGAESQESTPSEFVSPYITRSRMRQLLVRE
jgi:hypothetical protein